MGRQGGRLLVYTLTLHLATAGPGRQPIVDVTSFEELVERATYIAEVEVTDEVWVTWHGPVDFAQGNRCKLELLHEWLGHAESGELDLYVNAWDACPPKGIPLMLFAGKKVYYSNLATSGANTHIRHLAPFGDMVVPVVSWSWFIQRDGLVHVPAADHEAEGWPWQRLRDEVAARVVDREGLVLPGAPAPKSDRAQPRPPEVGPGVTTPEATPAAVAPLPRLPPTDAHRPPPFVDGRRHLETNVETMEAIRRFGVPGPQRRFLDLVALDEPIPEAEEQALNDARERILRLPQMLNLGRLHHTLTAYRLAADYGGHDELASMLRQREIWLRGLHSDGEVPPDVVRAHACALVDAEPDCPMRAWPGCDTAEDVSTVARAVCADPLTLEEVPRHRTYRFNSPP